MRKLYLLLCGLMAVTLAQSQTPNFIFADSVGTFNQLTNGIQLAAEVSDNDEGTGIDEYYINAMPIGFSFNYLGANYTSINVNSNGWAGLSGAYNTSNNYYTPALGGSTATNALRPVIAPFWADMSCDGIRYQLSGSAPNRVFTVEWLGLHWAYDATSTTLSVQLKLYEGTNTVQFIYRQEAGSPTGSGAQIGLSSGTTGTGSYQSVQSLTSPGVSSTGIATFSTRPVDGQVFTWRVPVSCSGPVVAGTIAASNSAVCAGESILLTNTGYTAGVGNIKYQWQRSTNGGTSWSSIPNGNNPDSIRVVQSVATVYRFVDTCFTGPTSAISNTVTVAMNQGNPVTYTIIGAGYEQDFESWVDGCIAGGQAIPDVNWRNGVELGDSSWRRYNQGALANWTNTFGTVSAPTFRSGQYSARLHSYSMQPGTTGNLDAYFNMSAPGSSNYRVGFAYRNVNSGATNADSLEVLISTNGGTSFTKLGAALKANTTWSLKEFDFNSTSAQTIIRLRGYNATDFSGDILIDTFYVQRLSNCSGTPSGGVAETGVTDACPGITFTVYNQGFTASAGLSGYSYQWQRSINNGTTWTDIAGANTPDSVRVSQSQTTLYRLRVSCSISGLSGNSSPVSVNTNPIVYVTVPAGSGYLEDFESWNSVCGNSDQPSDGWYNQHLIGDSSWRRNDQGATANWRSSSGQPTVSAARSGTYYARVHTYDTEGGRSGYLQLYANLGAATTYQFGFYYANGVSAFGGAANDSMQVLYSNNNGASFTRLTTLFTSADWTLQTFNVPGNTPQAVIRLRAFGDYATRDISVDSFFIIRTNACTSVSGGSLVTASTTVCPGVPFKIYATGFSSSQGVSGLTYQWQSRIGAGAWTNIAGATTPDSLTVSANVSTDYRLAVTCAATSTTAYSNVEAITITGQPVYATLGTGVSEDFESWSSVCATNDRPGSGANWTTSPVTSDSSWRRNDEGSTAGWTSSTGGYSPAFVSGAYSARFHTYDAAATTKGRMDFYVNASSAQYIRIGFYHINTSNAFGAADSLTVFASTDGGTTFTRLGMVNISSTWTLRTFDLAAPTATTVIRLQARSDYGTTDVGVDSFFVRPLVVCTGTPAAGTISSPVASPCAGISSKIYATGFTANTALGVSYQWESSPDGVTWTAISGATTPDSVSVTQTTEQRFRLKVRCSFSNDSAVSNVLIRSISTPAATYATLGTGVTEDFESWVTGCTSFERPSNNWLVRVVSGPASWRRYDQGVSAGGWANQSGGYTPAGRSGSYSARFHSWNTTDSASMSYYVNAGSNPIVQIGFYYVNAAGTDSVTVLASNDGGASFTRLGVVTVSAAWTRYNFSYTGANATTVIRLRAKGDNGGSDIGIDSFTVTPAVACAGAPAAGTSSGPASVCAANKLLISNSGYQSQSTTTGISYQWQMSTNSGTTWMNIAGATIPDSLVTAQMMPTQYRLQVTCSAGPVSNSNVVSVGITAVPTYAPVAAGVTEDFESWVSSSCGTNDRPGSSWSNAPSNGNNSWRRNDQGSSAGWTSPGSGVFGTATRSGTGSARFHTYDAPAGTVGILDFYMNAGVAANELGFYHFNTTGTDTLKVLFSSDAGATFTQLAAFANNGTGSNWVRRTVNINGATATSVLRFQVTSDYGTTDVGIDSMYLRPGQSVPVTLSRFAGVRKDAVNQLSWTTATEQNVARFKVERSFDGAGFEAIGAVESANAGGNSIRPTEYQFADAQHGNRSAWYRLRTEDKDGRSTLSSTVLIKGDLITKLQLVKVYPNPASEVITIAVQTPQGQKATVMITDMQGRVVMQQSLLLNAGVQNTSLNIARLAGGSYQLKLVCADGCESAVQQFVKE